MTAFRNYGLVLLNLLGLAGALAMAEIILYRHNLRADWTPGKTYTMSSHSLQVLDGVQQDVNIIAFVRKEDPRNAFLEDLFWRVGQRQPRGRTRVVDINRNPSLARKYHADAYGAVVVESGARQKMFSNIREEILMAAILQVTRNYEKTVYVLQGHGEGDIENSDRNRGYTTMRNVLEQEFYKVKPLTLFGTDAIPADAATVLIPGPKRDLLPAELLKLEAYVRSGRSLLVMMDPGSSPSLVAFLRRYRIGLPSEIIGDPEYRLAASEPLSARIHEKSKESPITSVLGVDPVFSLMRPIVELVTADDTQDESLLPLLTTSKGSWAIPVKSDDLPENLSYDEARGDRRGPFTVGVEMALNLDPAKVETPAEENRDEEPRVPNKLGRMIVYGDSDFANNFFIEILGNRDLLVNTVNRLALEDELIGVRPDRKATGREQFFVSSKEGYTTFLIGVILEPGVFLLLGVALFLKRRMT